MKSNVLVTGGLGYIGSHTVVAIMEAGYEVVILDSLANSSVDVLDRIERIVGQRPLFTQLDICDLKGLQTFFESEAGAGIATVIHFAAYKNVGESVDDPAKYYNNNLDSLDNILAEMVEQKIPSLVYSSSCSVYGNPEIVPVTEETPLQRAESPYGDTKKIGEDMIKDSADGDLVMAIALRYFNPIGAHPSNEIGEFPTQFMDNLIPALMSTALGGKEQFSVYGNTYNTPDGTCVRDYIDIVDLARAHVSAVERLGENDTNSRFEVFNLGTGKGVSVLEMIKMVEKVTGQEINYKIEEARQGDVEAVYADPALANDKLGWTAKRSLEDMMGTSWAWSNVIGN